MNQTMQQTQEQEVDMKSVIESQMAAAIVSNETVEDQAAACYRIVIEHITAIYDQLM